MVEYSKVSFTLTDTQMKTIKKAVKNKIGTTLRIGLEMFNGNDYCLQHKNKNKKSI